MDVELDLQLEGREPDRVWMSVWLAPSGEGSAAHVDGVSVQLVDAAGGELAPRTMLPIAGSVQGAMALSVELRAAEPIPEGAQVVATAWAGADQLQLSVPAAPFVALRDYVRGARIGLPDPDEVFLGPVSDAQHDALVACIPWVDQPVRSPEVAGVIEAEEEVRAEDLAADFDLDDEQAAWLKDLLDEPDL